MTEISEELKTRAQDLFKEVRITPDETKPFKEFYDSLDKETTKFNTKKEYSFSDFCFYLETAMKKPSELSRFHVYAFLNWLLNDPAGNAAAAKIITACNAIFPKTGILGFKKYAEWQSENLDGITGGNEPNEKIKEYLARTQPIQVMEIIMQYYKTILPRITGGTLRSSRKNPRKNIRRSTRRRNNKRRASTRKHNK